MKTSEAQMPDVVVVGAGICGSVVAGQLRRSHLSVMVVDAGPYLPPGQRVPEPDRRVWRYKTVGGSYDWTRVRAVGGRSHLWGGWCFRYDQPGLTRAGWPYGLDTLNTAYEAVERSLHVRRGLVDARYSNAAAELGLRVAPKHGACPSARLAWNAASTFAGRAARPYQVVLRIHVKARRAVSLLVADPLTGQQRELAARAVVLAASPIETARLLLTSDVDAARWGIGRTLTDHMVTSHVLLEPQPPPEPAGRGPFPGAVLFPNFVNTNAASRRSYPGGFSFEVTGPVPLTSLGLERLVPTGELDGWSATQVHGLGELFPHAGRYVDLDPLERDTLGRPVPRIHAAWTEEERTMADEMKRCAVTLADAMAIPGSRVIPFSDPLTAGAGHEASTCPMGRAPSFPCRPDGRLRACMNIWVADASVLPTSGDRHPSLTVLAHAHRVARAVIAAH